MPVYLGGGIGPLRAYVRLGGRPRPRSQEADAEASLLFGGIAIVAFGAWAAVEGLQGRWGNVGRGFGVLFVIATLVALVNRVAATALLTSWAYWGLAQLGYFEAMAGWLLWPQSNFEFGLSADQSFMWLLTAVLGLTGLVLMVALPPLVVGAVIELAWQAIASAGQVSREVLTEADEPEPEESVWIAPRTYGPIGGLLRGWRRALDFRSRASRSEFWFFLGMQLAVWLALPLFFRFIRPYVAADTFDLYSDLGATAFAWIGLVMPLPILAGAVRRLHDLDMRGWWVAVPLVFPFMLARPGTDGRNRFG